MLTPTRFMVRQEHTLALLESWNTETGSPRSQNSAAERFRRSLDRLVRLRLRYLANGRPADTLRLDVRLGPYMQEAAHELARSVPDV